MFSVVLLVLLLQDPIIDVDAFNIPEIKSSITRFKDPNPSYRGGELSFLNGKTTLTEEDSEFIPPNSSEEDLDDIENEEQLLIDTLIRSTFFPADKNERARFHKLCEPLINFDFNSLLSSVSGSTNEEDQNQESEENMIMRENMHSPFEAVLEVLENQNKRNRAAQINSTKKNSENDSERKQPVPSSIKISSLMRSSPSIIETSARGYISKNRSQDIPTVIYASSNYLQRRANNLHLPKVQNNSLSNHHLHQGRRKRNSRVSSSRQDPNLIPSLQSAFNNLGLEFEISNPEIDINNPSPPTAYQIPVGGKCLAGRRGVDQFTGVCVPLQDCPALVSITKQKQYTQMSCILSKTICGLNNGVATFCCPFYSFSNKVPGNIPMILDLNEKSPVSAPIPTREECGRSKPPSDTNIEQNDEFERIISGEFVTAGQFPWLAALGFPISSSRFRIGCSGSLITKRHVIAAAHCFHTSLRSSSTHVRLAELDSRTNEGIKHQEYLIIAINVPQFYGSNLLNDVGIATLDRDVEFNDYVQPLCLPYDNLDAPEVGTNLTAVGYGRHFIRQDFLTRPKFLTLEVQENSLCEQASYSSLSSIPVTIDHRVICTGGVSGEGVCQGDSGGPLLQFDPLNDRYILVGIASAIPEGLCAVEDNPSIHVRVGAFLPWIQSVVQP